MLLIKLVFPALFLLTLNYEYCYCEGDSTLNEEINKPASVPTDIQEIATETVTPSIDISNVNATKITQDANTINITSESPSTTPLPSAQNVTTIQDEFMGNFTETTSTINEVLSNNTVGTPVTPAPVTCPAECKCASTLLDAICTDRGLRQVPTGLSTRIKLLILTSNDITEIGEDTFKERNLYDLMSLLMNHNRISSLHPNAFVILKHLEVLDLGDNSLTTLDPNLFFHNTALITLRLDSNTNLEIPDEGILINSTTLHELNISSCNIQHLTAEVLSGTPSVDTVDLSGNPLQDLDTNILKGLPELRNLAIPKSLSSKGIELCTNHSKLERIQISGNENTIDCTKINADLATTPTIIILSNNVTAEDLNETRSSGIKEIISNLTNVQAIIQNTNTMNVTSMDESAALINPDIPIPPGDKLGKMILQPSVSKIADPKASTSSGLSTEQIDNLIIGALLMVIAVTTIAIIVNLNKKRLRKRRYKHQRKSQQAEEPEGEPLQNMASNP